METLTVITEFQIALKTGPNLAFAGLQSIKHKLQRKKHRTKKVPLITTYIFNNKETDTSTSSGRSGKLLLNVVVPFVIVVLK